MQLEWSVQSALPAERAGEPSLTVQEEQQPPVPAGIVAEEATASAQQQGSQQVDTPAAALLAALPAAEVAGAGEPPAAPPAALPAAVVCAAGQRAAEPPASLSEAGAGTFVPLACPQPFSASPQAALIKAGGSARFTVAFDGQQAGAHAALLVGQQRVVAAEQQQALKLALWAQEGEQPASQAVLAGGRGCGRGCPASMMALHASDSSGPARYKLLTPSFALTTRWRSRAACVQAPSTPTLVRHQSPCRSCWRS